jgi:hypothetical protein
VGNTTFCHAKISKSALNDAADQQVTQQYLLIRLICILGLLIATLTQDEILRRNSKKYTNLFVEYQDDAKHVPFEVVEYDLTSSFNRDNGSFTAPVKGVYSFSSCLLVWVADGGHMQLRLDRNGVQVEAAHMWRPESTADTGVETQLCLSRRLLMDTGDQVQLRVFGCVNCNVNKMAWFDKTGLTHSSFEGHLVFRVP